MLAIPPARLARYPRRRGQESRARLFEALRAAHDRGQHSFTLDELARETGMARSTVDHHLKWLQAEGKIRLGESRREIMLTEPGS